MCCSHSAAGGATGYEKRPQLHRHRASPARGGVWWWCHPSPVPFTGPALLRGGSGQVILGTRAPHVIFQEPEPRLRTLRQRGGPEGSAPVTGKDVAGSKCRRHDGDANKLAY